MILVVIKMKANEQFFSWLVIHRYTGSFKCELLTTSSLPSIVLSAEETLARPVIIKIKITGDVVLVKLPGVIERERMFMVRKVANRFTTLERKSRLGQVNFRKEFWDYY